MHSGIKRARLPVKSKMPKKDRLEKLRLKKPWIWSGDVNTMRQLESGWKPLDYVKFMHKRDEE
jgi:hypothetical protein